MDRPGIEPWRGEAAGNLLSYIAVLTVSLNDRYIKVLTDLTFIGPCIVIYFCSKTNQMHQCIKLFYFEMSLCSNICLTNACFCMYSLQLLMMDGKTVRNM